MVKLLQGIFQVGGATLSHRADGAVYLVEDEGEAVLIDCGSHLGVSKLLKNIAAEGIRPRNIKLIVGTQGHFDHVEAASHLKKMVPELKLALHSRDRGAVESGDSTGTCANYYKERFHPTRVDLTLKEGDEIEVGRKVLHVLHLPGHTRGHIGLWTEIKGLRFLFSGSTLTGGFWLQRSNLAEWKRSLDRLLRMSFDLFTESHSDCVLYAYTKERLLNSRSAVLNQAFLFHGMGIRTHVIGHGEPLV